MMTRLCHQGWMSLPVTHQSGNISAGVWQNFLLTNGSKSNYFFKGISGGNHTLFLLSFCWKSASFALSWVAFSCRSIRFDYQYDPSFTIINWWQFVSFKINWLVLLFHGWHCGKKLKVLIRWYWSGLIKMVFSIVMTAIKRFSFEIKVWIFIGLAQQEEIFQLLHKCFYL